MKRSLDNLRLLWKWRALVAGLIYPMILQIWRRVLQAELAELHGGALLNRAMRRGLTP